MGIPDETFTLRMVSTLSLLIASASALVLGLPKMIGDWKAFVEFSKACSPEVSSQIKSVRMEPGLVFVSSGFLTNTRETPNRDDSVGSLEEDSAFGMENDTRDTSHPSTLFGL
jgi:hypothetical protein